MIRCRLYSLVKLLWKQSWSLLIDVNLWAVLIVTHSFLYYRTAWPSERENVLLCYTSIHAIFTVPRVRASNSPGVGIGASSSFTSASSALSWTPSTNHAGVSFDRAMTWIYAWQIVFDECMEQSAARRCSYANRPEPSPLNICKVSYTPLTGVNTFGS